MSLLDNVLLQDDLPCDARKMGHLMRIIKEFGFDSFLDRKNIVLQYNNVEKYINDNKADLKTLFGDSFVTIKNNNFVNMLNEYLIELWHAQIIGNNDKAFLTLFTNK